MTDLTIAANLELGDEAKLEGNWNSYATFTVVKIEENAIHVVRPYIHTSDFSYTGGVIPYVGMENFTLSPDTKVDLLRKNPVKLK